VQEVVSSNLTSPTIFPSATSGDPERWIALSSQPGGAGRGDPAGLLRRPVMVGHRAMTAFRRFPGAVRLTEIFPVLGMAAPGLGRM
jgi:hypothetical protein